MADGRSNRHGAPVATLLATLVAVVLCSCAAPRQPPPAHQRGEAVVVASFNFPESELLAEIYAQALERAGIPVRREFGLGTREMVLPALRQGLVDVVPEYLGTALTAVAPQARVDRRDTPQVLAALRDALAKWRLEVLTPAPASDQNGFAVTRATALRWQVRTLSELARADRPLRLAAPSECPSRPYCLPGLSRVYGLRFSRVESIDDGAQRVTALTEGMVDLAVVFTTDGHLAGTGLVLLTDDRRLQPTEQVAPVVSDRAIQRYGTRISDALDPVSAQLDTGALRFLNWRVQVAGKPFAAEAGAWLRRHGLAS